MQSEYETLIGKAIANIRTFLLSEKPTLIEKLFGIPLLGINMPGPLHT